MGISNLLCYCRILLKKMRWGIIVAFPLLLNAQEYDRPHVGLVLSGGGAKGAAHVGVLKVLEEAGIPIDYIAGTSMGAIIGGLYSVGYTAQELDSLVRSQDWMALLTDQVERPYRSFQNKVLHDRFLLSIPFTPHSKLTMPSGIMKGQSILNRFSDLTVGFHQMSSFDSLPIPFACVAGDLIEGKEVVLRRGNLPLAMRASMAVPGVFSPVYLDDMVLIDGGVFNNFPVDVVENMGADIIIGVDLSTESFVKPTYQSVTEIGNRLAFLVGEKKYRQNKTKVDLYLNPGLKGYTSADFKADAIDTMLIMGEQVARQHWKELMALREKVGSVKAYANKSSIKRTDSLYVERVRIEGLYSHEKAWLFRNLKIKEDCFISFAEIERQVQMLQGLGYFSNVSYRIVDKENDSLHKILVFSLKERSKGCFNVGMHIDTEEVAAILMNGRLNFGKYDRNELFSSVKISQNPKMNIGYMYHTSWILDLGVEYELSYKDFKLFQNGKKYDRTSYLQNHISAFLKEDLSRYVTCKLGVQYDFFSNVSKLYSVDYICDYLKKEDYVGSFFELDFDNSDDLTYPTYGVQCNIRGSCSGNDVFSSHSYMFGACQFKVKTACLLSSRFCVLPEIFGRVLWGNTIPNFFVNYIGGEYLGRYMIGQQPFYGVHYAELVDNILLGGYLQLRYQIADKHYVSCIGNWASYNNNLVHVFNGSSVTGVAMKYSYDSLIGPFSMTLDYSNRTKDFGGYVSLGYYF